MSWTVLAHDSRLGVPGGPAGGPVVPPPAAARVVSFRPPPPDGRPVDYRPEVNATTRLLDLGADHLTFVGLETDSALAPLLLWDAAHALPVGGTITLLGDPGIAPYLGRPYFRSGLEVAKADPAGTTFLKKAELPAEVDRGLDRWTFGIPTGPGDATGLNAVVRRILELGVHEFEIILCGRPGANFKYLDKVQVVGEDLNRLPVPIAAKKNRIAEHARYENLCIIHDRVFLPRDFHDAVRKFGDLFPVVGFQSLWCDDPYNLVVKRYSDYIRLLNPAPLYRGSADPEACRVWQPGLLPEGERGGFLAANALRYNQGNYCSGSLYLCKRAVWRACPQDGRLNWLEMEDVEFGLRGDRQGIPHRVNPHAFTQTLFTRPPLLCRGLLYETANGSLIKSVNLLEEVHFQRKPMARISVADAHAKLLAFVAKWVPRHFRDVYAAELDRAANDGVTWGRQVAVAVYGAAVGFGEENVLRFLRDVESHLVFDTFSAGLKRFLVEHFAIHGANGKDTLVEHGAILENMILYRGRGNLFYHSQAEYFPEPTTKLRWGTWFSARRMARHDGELFHTPGGQPGFERAIRNSTPFRDYYEGQA